MIGRRGWIGLATVAALLALWFVLTTLTGQITSARFPSPAEFSASLTQINTRGYAGAVLLSHAWHSLLLVLMGFAVAVGTGVPLGLWMGWNRRVEALVNPVFLIIRPIPPLAWIPLAILWLGLGDAAKIMVIWFAAFVPSVINAFTGVRTIDRPVFEAARMLGTPPWRMVCEVIVPAASPMIFTGLRLSLQASWTTLVAAELVGALVGVGFVLNMAQQDIYPGMILVGMLTVGVLGFITTLALGHAERRALAWNVAATD
ncbi:MAG: ABC transporter permease [Methylobacterium sp.]|jgi:taurine transport system permease protein|nr:ABC transporter permease [Methylobacterium sp.]MCE2933836.1 ABC transporter permease [Hyphomicrobiales bacterium]MCZ8271864.1 ABC transporter permease [Beijerinckiaceae bacterium]MCA3637249.1 ABC transporter permease [Methylobacterium sp.]MCA3640747.1 ABC transporter permease [Methylobacterium sp.]